MKFNLEMRRLIGFIAKSKRTSHSSSKLKEQMDELNRERISRGSVSSGFVRIMKGTVKNDDTLRWERRAIQAGFVNIPFSIKYYNKYTDP